MQTALPRRAAITGVAAASAPRPQVAHESSDSLLDDILGGLGGDGPPAKQAAALGTAACAPPLQITPGATGPASR